MRFPLIYADPPWAYRNENASKKFGGTAHLHYPTHGLIDMVRWPLGDLAAKNSLIFMWATFPKLPEALAVLAAWGFEYVTSPFVWFKSYKSGKPFCGVGFWTRCGAEVVLLGRKGKGLPRMSKSVRQIVQHQTIGHSSKPPIVRDKILELVGDITPRIELFSRNPEIPGWTHTGFESDGRSIEDAIKHYSGL